MFRKALHRLRRRFRRPATGRFQPYNFTLADRYPWLFEFAAQQIDVEAPRLLSFGCSHGLEVAALRKYFPSAEIRGLDIDPRNIATCVKSIGNYAGLSFATASTTEEEASQSYDAIFCLAVLVHGDLTSLGAERCDHLICFEDFERIVRDFSRCLRPNGLLCLHTTNFRFCDSDVAGDFDVLLEAQSHQLAADVKFDRSNRLLPNENYYPVVFRKRV